MNALLRWLGAIFAQPDKAVHAVVEGVLAFVVVAAFGAAVVTLLATLWAGAAIAWFKERYDKAHPAAHTWDGWDAFAGLLGALAGVTLGYAVVTWGVGSAEVADAQQVRHIATQPRHFVAQAAHHAGRLPGLIEGAHVHL
jgi:hypothetical protein